MRLRVLLAVFLLAACAQQKDPIVRTIDRVTKAAKDRDAKDVMASIAATYPGRADLELELRRYFFAYDHVDVTVRELESQSTPEGGWATFRVDFKGTPKKAGGLDQFLPRTATYRFALDFVADSGEWKIAKAQWERDR